MWTSSASGTSAKPSASGRGKKGSTMSARAQQVFQEILARGFRAYPRGIVNGFLFAGLTAAFVWPVVAHELLVGWLAASVAIAGYRWSLARQFLRAHPAAGELGRWARRAAVGYGATGLLWGILGAACIHYAPDAREYILWWDSW